MSAQINKSRIMKRAWEIYRQENNAVRFGWGSSRKYEFRFALSRAWREEKQAVAMANTPKTINTVVDTPSLAFMAGAAAQYDNAVRGTYFGD